MNGPARKSDVSASWLGVAGPLDDATDEGLDEFASENVLLEARGWMEMGREKFATVGDSTASCSKLSKLSVGSTRKAAYVPVMIMQSFVVRRQACADCVYRQYVKICSQFELYYGRLRRRRQGWALITTKRDKHFTDTWRLGSCVSF